MKIRDNDMANQDSGGLTRRHFLGLTGRVVAGTAVGSAALSALSPLEARATDQRAMEYFRKGFQLAEQGQYEEALEMYKKGKEIDGTINKLPAFKTKKAGELYDLGFSLEGKDSQKAIMYYSQAIVLDPDNPMPYHQTARLLAENIKPEKWSAYFKKAISLQPNYTPSIGDFGRNLTKAGRHQEAYFWNRVYFLLEPKETLRADIVSYIIENKKSLNIH